MEDATRVGTDQHADLNNGCVNLLLENFVIYPPDIIEVVFTGKSHGGDAISMAAAVIDKKLKFSKAFYRYVLCEQLYQDLQQRLDLKSFLTDMFDVDFLAKYTKPFTVSNYV